MDIEKLGSLLARVKEATGPNYQLECDIMMAVEPERKNLLLLPQNYTASLNAATTLCERVLPGWWWKVGTCCVSDDACVAPDYNSPIHGERLKREFPLPAERYFDEELGRLTWGPFGEGFDIDRRPPGNVPLALLEALLSALIEIEKAKE